jgi:hypothetical protein
VTGHVYMPGTAFLYAYVHEQPLTNGQGLLFVVC